MVPSQSTTSNVPSRDSHLRTYVAYAQRVYAIITTTIWSQPSRYAAARTRSSTLALRDRTAPCKTACAKSGLRLLGNNVGRI